jgi:hypothetical protein
VFMSVSAFTGYYRHTSKSVALALPHSRPVCFASHEPALADNVFITITDLPIVFRGDDMSRWVFAVALETDSTQLSSTGTTIARDANEGKMVDRPRRVGGYNSQLKGSMAFEGSSRLEGRGRTDIVCLAHAVGHSSVFSLSSQIGGLGFDLSYPVRQYL